MDNTFYTSPENIDDEHLVLPRAEAHHARHVLRLKKGDIVMVVDGAGNGYKAEIARFSKNKVECGIVARIRHYGEPAHFITLAAGLSAGFKFDEVIQRGTELGISRFIPMVTEKSKVKIVGERRQISRASRWRKVAIASVKQSGRSLVPDIGPVVPMEHIFHGYHDLGRKILFDATHSTKSLSDIPGLANEKNLTLFVGPESGFSISEIEAAREYGCDIVTLGKRVLRTENASPVAAAVVMHILGELS
jgi:16S rRNA (uracil1498-N3)-methyltransferase